MNESTMTENQCFSFPRFMQLLKSDLRINKSKYIRTLIAILGCFFTIALLISIFAIDELSGNIERFVGTVNYEDIIDSTVKSYVVSYQFTSLLIISVGLTVLGSMTFVSMNSKSGRISTLMLPASMPEKFILRFLVYFVGGTIILIAGYYIGSLIMYCAFASKYSESDDLLVYFINASYWKEVGKLSLPLLFGNALYALGSSIWPKASWVKTWVVTVIFQVVIMFFIAFGLFNFSTLIYRWLKNFEDYESFMKCAYYGVFTLLIVVCWALAWWRFRTTQIVQKFCKK